MGEYQFRLLGVTFLMFALAQLSPNENFTYVGGALFVAVVWGIVYTTRKT